MTTPQKFELRAVGDCPFGTGLPITNPGREAADYWQCQVATEQGFDPAIESLVVLFLDGEKRLFGHHVVVRGNSIACVWESCQFYRAVVLAGASYIIVVHNHPGERPSPSGPDMVSTSHIHSAAPMLGIALLDHVIVGDGPHFSFAEAGHLDKKAEADADYVAPIVARDRLSVVMDVLAPDTELQRLFFDRARDRGIPADECVLEIARDLFKRCLRAYLHEPSVSVTLALERAPEMRKLISLAAEEHGIGPCQYTWEVLVPKIKDFLATKSAAPPTVTAF